MPAAHHKSHVVATRTIRSWSDAQQLHGWFEKQRPQWIFRGQTDLNWGLATTFERAVRSLAPQDVPQLQIEGALLRRFKRQAHHYLPDPPSDDSWLHWLALMQHYGAPTRLLDWTYSFFVGLHFALDGDGRPAALWALNKDWATETSRALLPLHDWKQLEADQNLARKGTFAMLFAKDGLTRARFVLPVNPYQLDQRLAIQQGTFVVPGDIEATFEDNLAAMLRLEAQPQTVFKIEINLNREERREMIGQLFRMNVTPTTLFPGLDGFSRTLKSTMVFRNMLVADTDWPVTGTRWPTKIPPA